MSLYWIYVAARFTFGHSNTFILHRARCGKRVSCAIVNCLSQLGEFSVRLMWCFPRFIVFAPPFACPSLLFMAFANAPQVPYLCRLFMHKSYQMQNSKDIFCCCSTNMTGSNWAATHFRGLGSPICWKFMEDQIRHIIIIICQDERYVCRWIKPRRVSIETQRDRDNGQVFTRYTFIMGIKCTTIRARAHNCRITRRPLQNE